jgi:hypothetical protein
MKGWLVGALIAVGVILAFIAVAFSQGAPTAPTARLYTPLNPSASQQLSIGLNMGTYSVVAPNTVWGLGMHFVYSAVETTSTGQTYLLANNLTVAPIVGASQGSFYQLPGTIGVVTTAVCSNVGCAGAWENVTVTAYGVVVTPFQVWDSPTSVSTFSSAAETSCNAGLPCAPQTASPAGLKTPAVPTKAALDTFMLEVLVPVTVLIAFESFGVYAVLAKHPVLPAVGVVAVFAVILEFLLL